MHQHTASCRAQVFQQEPKVSWTAAEVLGGFRKWSYRKVVLVQSNEASWSSWNFHASYVHALSHSHYRFLNQCGQKTTKQRLPGLPQDISLTGWLWLPEQQVKWDRFKRSFILLPSKQVKKSIMTFQVEPTSWTHQISSTRDGSHLRFGGPSELLNLYEFRKNDLDLSRWSKRNECIRPKKELGFLCDKWSMPKELRQIPSCTPCQFAEARLMPWLLPLTFQCGCHVMSQVLGISHLGRVGLTRSVTFWQQQILLRL